MPPLADELRRLLNRAIVEARTVAERGAKVALEALAVHHHEPHGSMTPDQRELRNRLRAHGRQLGDERDQKKGTQALGRLLREVAYEHWHRMLFARFLAENGLLIEPEHRVSITLAECEDLARDRGEDPWALAAGFAERMLPEIFRTGDPALAVTLPPESRQRLQALVSDLPSAVFTADDSLGWTYQFWQSAEKDAVNARVKSGEKITGETLPAVTQLFTEPYMVSFLLHNTLGAWHAAKVLAARPDLAASAASEQELREAVRLPGCDFDYLRFVRDPKDGDEEGRPTGPWRAAAGAFEGWPRTAAELRILDPCCGSGHFLAAAFDLLVRLREAEEGLAMPDAIRAVLADNLFGLELDARCTQIAAFNLALAAWRLAGQPIDLPPMHLACCGMGPNATKDQWIALAEKAAAAGGIPAKRDLFEVEDSLLSAPLRNSLEALHDLFTQAPELGSLIDPRELPTQLFHANFSALQPLLSEVLKAEAGDEETRERAVAAQGMAKAAEILIGPPSGYTLVLTNVPYLGRGSHSDLLRDFADQHYKEAKGDLATIFLTRILKWLAPGGTTALVTPQNWLFLTSYRKLRERMLTRQTWNIVARLGPAAFRDMNWWAANTALLAVSVSEPHSGAVLAGFDASANKLVAVKAALLRGEQPPESSDDAAIAASDAETDGDEPAGGPPDGSVKIVLQADQLSNPDARVTLKAGSSLALLLERAEAYQGVKTGDDERLRRCFWEFASCDEPWTPYQSTVEVSEPWGGLFYRIDSRENLWARPQGKGAWTRVGVAVSQMNGMPVALYSSERFDSNMSPIVPREPSELSAIWCFCTSADFGTAVRSIDQALKVTNASLTKVPFDLAQWQTVGAQTYPNGLPEPQSNDPTQWLFHGHPAGMLAAGPASASPLGIADAVGADRHPSLICRTPNSGAWLQVAVARLLGYRWPAELDPEMRLDIASRDWVERCREMKGFADADGIVCLSPARGEASAADRVRRLLAAALGDRWSAATERSLLAAAATSGASPSAATLEEWLGERFFEEHCKLFHHRPFVWHIWDGRKDGFNALVNYHRLAGADGAGRRLLESLSFTYLGEWIDRQRAEQKDGREGADGRLAAALRLQAELRKILEGEPPYDLFVRWKPLARQPIGWEPDINDGVRLNIRPFLQAQGMGRKGAGILRWKPNVKWGKDRGQEPVKLRPREEFPWFWSCEPEEKPDHRIDFGAGAPGVGAPGAAPAGAEFDGTRWNDLHYTRKAKEAARSRAAKEVHGV